MPSPDVRAYLDLTLDDRGPMDLFRSAVLNYASWLPDVELVEGHTETVLLESMAVVVSELVLAVNRLPDGMAELLLGLFGVTRDVGSPPSASVRFTSNGAFRVEAAAGVRVRLELPGGSPPVVFTTTGPLVIPQFATETVVPATGERHTADANGIPAGTALTPLDSVPGVDAASLATVPAGGVDPETGEGFLNRGMALFRSLSSVLVRPDQFTAATVLDPRYPRATTVDLYDPGQAGNPGDHPGHVTVAVLGVDGAAVPEPERAALAVTLAGRAQANLAVHVIDPTVTAVTVGVTVRGRPGFTDAAIVAAVTSAVEGLLDPQTWPWEPTVWRLSVVAAVDAADGVARVEQVLLNGAETDVTLPGVAPLADVGAVTVTVNR